MDTYRGIVIDTRTDSRAVSVGCGADSMEDAQAYFEESAPAGWKLASIEKVSR